MADIQSLINLPTEAFAAISAGYVAYRLAYTGRDNHHDTIDTVLITVVFATMAQTSATAFTSAILALWPALENVAWLSWFAVGIGVLFAICTAAFWRRVGGPKTFDFLRKRGISHSDRNLNAWETIVERDNLKPSMIVVRKKDGTAVMCDRLDDFKDDAHGPMIQGNDGSVAIYITSSRSKDSIDWEPQDPSASNDWGAEITYIPSSEIAEIAIRY